MLNKLILLVFNFQIIKKQTIFQISKEAADGSELCVKRIQELIEMAKESS